MMQTERYCATLGQLSPVDAVRAIHAAFLQLSAVDAGAESLDNGPALARLSDCLKQAGHLGFLGKG